MPGTLGPVLGSPVQERHGEVYGRVPQWASKMIRGLEHLSYEERLKRAGTVQPGEEKAPGDHIHMEK